MRRIMGAAMCLLGIHELVEVDAWSRRCARCGTIKQDTPKGYFYRNPDGKWWFSFMANFWF